MTSQTCFKMAEIELRAVVCTRRLSDEKSINSEKHLKLEIAKLKNNVSKKVTKTKNMNSIMFIGENCVFDNEGSSKKNITQHAQEEFDDEGVQSNNGSEGSEPGSEGDRKKRCCDRYDSSESSDSGVVVLSSTDCSSSSSACSGHSDITSDPGSPYSSPTSAALCSPEEFPGSHSEESEDSPMSPSLEEETSPVIEEPRPPDPCWPFDEELKPPPPTQSSCRVDKKRPYPFCSSNPTSTPKRFRNNSGNTGTTININLNNNISQTTNSNTASLIPYQPVNLNSSHQKQSFQKLDSKINSTLEASSRQPLPPPPQQVQQQQQQQQQKWTLPKSVLGTEAIKGQGKITEYFKTQIKSTLPCQKSGISQLTKKGQSQVKSSVKKDGIDKFLRIYSGNCPTAKEMCVQPVLVSETAEGSRSSKILSLLHETEPNRSNKESASVQQQQQQQTDEACEPVSESKHHGDVTLPDFQKQDCDEEDCVVVISDYEKKKKNKNQKNKHHNRLSVQTEKTQKNGTVVEFNSNNNTMKGSNSNVLSDFSCKAVDSMLSMLSSSPSIDTSNKVLSDKEVCVVNRVNVSVPDKSTAAVISLDEIICSHDTMVLPSLKKSSSSHREPPITVVETVSTCLSVEKDEKKAIHVIEIIESRSCEGVASPDAENKTEIATPLSPILSAPRVIRFPVPQRTQTGNVDTTVQCVRCCWSECDHEFHCTSKLLEHLQSHHVNTQMRREQFVCLWIGCKVHARPSCSLSWLERHVLSHGGSKPFRCIVDDCGQRFSSQSSLERHVNGHFNAPNGVNGSGSASSSTRRSTDVVPNKLFRRNGKKLRYRRQPWSARMFDYIDTGMMEGLQHRLLTYTQQQLGNITSEEQEEQISQGNLLALRSKILARRVDNDGIVRFLIRWTPEEIIPDEWLSENEVKSTQLVPLSRLQPRASVHLHHSMLPPNSKSTRKPRKPQQTASSSTTTQARSLS